MRLWGTAELLDGWRDRLHEPVSIEPYQVHLRNTNGRAGDEPYVYRSLRTRWVQRETRAAPDRHLTRSERRERRHAEGLWQIIVCAITRERWTHRAEADDMVSRLGFDVEVLSRTTDRRNTSPVELAADLGRTVERNYDKIGSGQSDNSAVLTDGTRTARAGSIGGR